MQTEKTRHLRTSHQCLAGSFDDRDLHSVGVLCVGGRKCESERTAGIDKFQHRISGQ